MNMFITSIVVIVSQAYACVQTYQNVYIRYVTFWGISYTSIKLLKTADGVIYITVFPRLLCRLVLARHLRDSYHLRA